MTCLFKITTAGALLGLAAACTTVDSGTIRNMKPDGAAFTNALFGEYVALADLAWAESDHQMGALYYLKAERTAMGELVLPETLADQKMPAPSVREIAGARSRLLEMFDKGARSRAPEASARAQAMFDCWLEEQEKGWQVWDIERCHEGLRQAMGRVASALETPPTAVAMAALDFNVAPPGVHSFFVFFAFDSEAIDEAAAGTVSEAVRAMKAAAKPRVIVSGHADRSGPESYNASLARRRAAAVSHALVAGGVDASTVRATWFGEARPLIKTADGVRNEDNRRVRITVIDD